MIKKLSMFIDKCSSCPYYHYDVNADEHECKNSGRFLFFNDYHIRPGKNGAFSDKIIAEWCELEDK